MLLLSSLLGPARPPVASREDVASAGGIYRVRKRAEALVAAALQGTEIISVLPGERCLVCLCDYEVNEEIRQLTKCNHLFHRECIDQVRKVYESLLGVALTGFDSGLQRAGTRVHCAGVRASTKRTRARPSGLMLLPLPFLWFDFSHSVLDDMGRNSHIGMHFLLCSGC